MPDDRNRLVLNADFQTVRRVLGDLFPSSGGADDDGRAIAELVLAEVLNNVVEHAYGGSGGRIDLTLRRQGDCLAFRVADRGRPYPAARLPARAPAAAPDREGGFGWELIRALANGVAYRRIGVVNVLVFRVRLNNAVAAA